MIALNINYMTNHRHYGVISIISNIRTILENEELPEFAPMIVRLAQVRTREVHVYIHHFLAIGMLRRRDTFNNVDLAWLPSDILGGKVIWRIFHIHRRELTKRTPF